MSIKTQKSKIKRREKVRSLVATVGRIKLADALRLGVESIDVAVFNAEFPARWRDVLERLAEPHGVDIQGTEFKSLFNMIGVVHSEKSPSINAPLAGGSALTASCLETNVNDKPQKKQGISARADRAAS